jgi:hypothetical protein
MVDQIVVDQNCEDMVRFASPADITYATAVTHMRECIDGLQINWINLDPVLLSLQPISNLTKRFERPQFRCRIEGWKIPEYYSSRRQRS